MSPVVVVIVPPLVALIKTVPPNAVPPVPPADASDPCALADTSSVLAIVIDPPAVVTLAMPPTAMGALVLVFLAETVAKPAVRLVPTPPAAKRAWPAMPLVGASALTLTPPAMVTAPRSARTAALDAARTLRLDSKLMFGLPAATLSATVALVIERTMVFDV